MLGGGGKEYEPWPAIALEKFSTEAQTPMHRRAFALFALHRPATWGRDPDGLATLSGRRNKRRTRQNRQTANLFPAHRDLRAEIDNIERQQFMMLHTTKGKPFGPVYFGAWFKREMTRLGFGGLQLHGLRKNAVNALLEAGCSEAETASITGQSLQVVQHYAKKVNQPRLAGSAIRKWENAE